MLDQERAGTAGAMIDETTAAAAVAASGARGYLDGRALAEVFAWLRPDDLIWNYWVNNYLQGKTPPPFDILYWNADTTRLPAALHRDFIRLALSNALTKPGAATMLGSAVDLEKVDTDTYVIAGIADHLCPWQSCYRTTQMLGGPITFVLSTSGHIASMVNPPGNPKATFQTAGENPADPRDWLASAQTVSGSWWPHYSEWLAARSGPDRKAGRRPAARATKCSPLPPVPMFTTANIRSVAVGDQILRTSVRPARRVRFGRAAAAGPPLLLINGIGASLELLEPFVDEVDPSIEVIRFDVPGVGGSPLPSRPYRFTGLCAQIGRMLTELGYGTVDVLGISWGGGVAQHFAAVQRARCRRLVLVSTATGALMVPARPSVLATMVTPRRYTDRAYLQQNAARLYGGSARTDPSRVTAAMNAHNRVGSARGYLYQLAAGAGWTSLPLLPRLTQPTLIVSGNDDPIIPLANARLMHRLIPNSTLHVFHGGHLGLVTEAAEVAPVISQFLIAPEPTSPSTRTGPSAPTGSSAPTEPAVRRRP